MNKIKGLLLFALWNCCMQSSGGSKENDPLESGRGFIESSLKGDYGEAQKYILQDSSNIQYFNGYERF